MMGPFLDVEKPLLELEDKIRELKKLNTRGGVDLTPEISALERKANELKTEIFNNLSPWDRVQIARHARRPTFLDYIGMIFEEFIELHGDRLFANDPSIVGGFAELDGRKIMVIGHQKGKDAKDKLYRNFGMPKPEGFRKANRLMTLAEKFHLPLITFIDTPGAYPGIDAEERGQFMAIAKNLELMSFLRTPIVVVIIGEGGSGGALAIGVGDRILILENAIYSVISPEGCASILWKDDKRAPEAAKVLKLTSRDLLQLGVVDEVIPEPMGGAHHDPEKTANNLKESIIRNLNYCLEIELDELISRRYRKFREMDKYKLAYKDAVC